MSSVKTICFKIMTNLKIETSEEYIRFLQVEKHNFENLYDSKVDYNVTRNNFEIISVLGVGSFGKVVLIQEEESGEFYAQKILAKETLVKTKQVDHTLNEKRTLQSIHFNFTVNLIYFYQDNSYLYFVLPFVAGGELFTQLQKAGELAEHIARFYVSQVLLGLEYLHNLDLIYRDIKPENLLIDRNGYIKITDFGLCKLVKERTYTVCGTPEYIAPEVILNKGYNKSVDFWAFGVLVFEMCSGSSPFWAFETLQLYEKITSGKFKMVKNFTKGLKDLIRHLLQPDVSKRIGCLKGGIKDIKDHVWFREINWITLLNYRHTPPFKPNLAGPDDTSSFDTAYEMVDINFPVSEKTHYNEFFTAF